MGIACKPIWNFILFFFLLVVTASGQPKCKIEYYSTEQGLSHQRVTTILKDRQGFMWFGSWDGINRFDGHSFISYKSSPGDSSKLGNDRIDQIVEDQSNHLWIQAYDRQVYRFDKKREQFQPLSALINLENPKLAFSQILAAANGVVWLQSSDEGLFCVPQNDSLKGRFAWFKKGLPADYRLPSNTIHFFHEDAQHQVWIGTPEGLSCLVRSASGDYKNSPAVPEWLADGMDIATFDEDSGHLYFAGSGGDLIIYNKRQRSFSSTKISPDRLNAISRSEKANVIYFTSAAGDLITYDLSDHTISKVNYHPNEPLHSLFEDSRGILWIEPENSGAIRFDPSKGSFQFFSQKNGTLLTTIGNRFKVLEDANGTIWVNMKGGGFSYYNQAKGALDFFVNTPDAANFGLPNLVYNIYYDRAGIFWLTTYEKELVKIILQVNDFKQELLVEQAHSPSDNEVRGILYDDRDRLWLGTKSSRLYVIQKDIPVHGLFDNEPREGIGSIYSILQDSRRNIWLATKGNGIYMASPINGDETKYHLKHFFPDKRNPNSLKGKDIYSLLEDRQGRIWAGTFDEGLNLIQYEKDSVQFVHGGYAFENYPKEGFHKIRHMALDSSGNIWIATTDGLLLLDAGNNQSQAYRYKTYRKIPGDKESLGNNDVQFIHRDSKNRMWLATSGGGFCQAVGGNSFKSLQFRNYTTRDGLPNDYILSCAEDKQGNLWIATENGLSKFNPDTKTFRNYDAYDGLPKLAFSEASACYRLAGDQLIFGTTKGFLTFNSARINSYRIAAEIALTNLQINNEEARPATRGSVLETDINYISKLTLKYNQNIISIDYAILDHRAGNRQAFAYRLLGFDSTWHDDHQFRRATYTNLRPGHYIFEVKSLSTDLYSNQPYKRLVITILPPFWKTWWAYLLYALFAVVVLYVIRRYAIAMIRLRNKMAVEQKLAALKLNFFTNVSHELRTPLTLIVNPLEQVARKGNLSTELASYIDVARKNANRMVHFINQLLDLRKVQSDKATLHISRLDIVAFVQKIGDYFTEAAGSKHIRLDILAEQQELIAWVDPDKIEVVIYNILGNAIKFTPGGKAIRVMIRPVPEEQSFSIAVRDQGPGVPKGELKEIFELFHEGEQVPGRTSKGTGIGLALSKEFVDLHGGVIWAENNEDSGLTVTLKLKTGFQHYHPNKVSFTNMNETIPVGVKPIGQQLIPQLTGASPLKDPGAPLVLLVEDNDELRSFIKGQLDEFYRVETATDGEDGLQKAISLIPDLIVSDIMMPKMDGIQMLERVKNDINTSHIPVVLLSAKYSIESQIEGLKYGADYYITKPFHNEFLIASIDNLLRQRKKLFEALVEKKRSIGLSPEAVVITSRDETFLKEVIKVVENKMADVDFNIDAVAESLAMSHKTFYRKFKSLTSLTPVEFVRDMRLQRARQLLDAGSGNISEVAYEVGFSNPKYFSTCFKDKYQVSPTDYLKSNAG